MLRIIFVFFLLSTVTGCSAINYYAQQKEVADLDRLYREGKISEKSYLDMRAKALNKFSPRSNVTYNYIIKH